MGQRAYLNEAFSTESDIITGQSGGDQEAKKSPKTVIFYRLPLVVSAIKGLSPGAKALFAVLFFRAYGGRSCRVGLRTLARLMAADRSSVRGWRKELADRRIIIVVHERELCNYFLAPKYRVGKSIPLLSEIMKRKGVSRSEKLLFSLLSYKEGSEERSWSKQWELARDLGCSLRTIRRGVKSIKSRCKAQIRVRRLNRKNGNTYTITLGAVKEGRIFGDNSHRTESPHINKKRKVGSVLEDLRQRLHGKILSKRPSPDPFGPWAVADLAIEAGINEKVARQLAFEDMQPYESFAQAMDNAEIKRAYVWQEAARQGKSQPYFNKAGYIVNALKGAKKEVKTIVTTRLYRRAAKELRKHKRQNIAAKNKKPMSKRTFERRRRKLIRSLGVIA